MKSLVLILLSFLLYQSSFAQDAVTIVAVGEAEAEKDKLGFTDYKKSFELSPKELTLLKELKGLFISDFKFYKHLFEVTENEIAVPAKDALETWASESYRYIIQTELTKAGESIELALKLFDLKDKKSIFDKKSNINFSNIRSYGHGLSDEIYKAITGNESIFKSKIVFVSDRTSRKSDTRKELYIMDFDGKRIQRLTYLNSMIISPAISPDNTKLLFSVIEGKWRKSSRGKVHKVKNLNLYLMDLKTKKTTLISELNGINSGAVFAHDGEHIYLTLSNQTNADIYKMNLKTKKKEKVTKHFLDDVDPHINKAGDLMTFLSGRSGKAMIYTMDPRSLEKDVKRISYVGRFNAAPRFSPDGKEIVFSSWVDNRFDLYKIGSDGNNLVRLTKNFGSNEEGWFSPDGQFIVFTSQRVISRKKAVQDIYIMNREGEILSKITNNFGKIYTPRWSN